MNRHRRPWEGECSSAYPSEYTPGGAFYEEVAHFRQTVGIPILLREKKCTFLYT